jgi:hypothetical protein
MPTDSNRYLATAARLLFALSVFCAARPADGASTAWHSSNVRAPITINAPAGVAAGGTLCFSVISFGGPASITVEINQVLLTVIEVATGGTGPPVYCVKIPFGSSGSPITITAVGPSGAVATATVMVH